MIDWHALHQHAPAHDAPPIAQGYDISFNPDFSSIIVVDGTPLVLTQYEAPVPAQLYITVMDQDKTTGQLTPKAWYPTDWSAPELGGLWVPCAGSLTPWNTHAGGEEYEPDGMSRGAAMMMKWLCV